jgi:phage anti-repressor protein
MQRTLKISPLSGRNNWDCVFCMVRAEPIWFNETVIITVLKSVAKKHLLKTEDFYVRCDYSDNWSVWFSETVIITVLKSVARKRLVKTKDFYVSCDYNNNWCVWFSGTVIVGYGGDPRVVGGSDIQSEALSRCTLTRDSIQNTSACGKHLKKYSWFTSATYAKRFTKKNCYDYLQ